jgi:hypothetical protein
LGGEFEASILNITRSLECDLFNQNKVVSQDYNLTKGLSPFWAQEYVGSDLLKQEMVEKKINTSNATTLLGVWDSSNNSHGELVGNLVAGPFASSLITSDLPPDYVNLHATENYFEAYEQALDQFNKNSHHPRFINNSMKWENSSLTSQVVKKLATEKNVVFVTAAGNDPDLTEELKRESSRAGHSIIVASHALMDLALNSLVLPLK